MDNKQYASGGFTIIEVVLFLAVSSLLLLGAMVGVSSALKNTQFNDTTSTTQSFLEKTYIDVSTGLNFTEKGYVCDAAGVITKDVMSDVEPGESNCVVLGRMIEFSPGLDDAANKVVVKYISSGIPSSTLTTGDLGSFGAGLYEPQVSSLSDLSRDFFLPWSAIITEAKFVQGFSETSIDRVAIMRSPASEKMLIYGFNGAPASSSDFADVSNLILNDRSIVLCVQSDPGPFAKKAVLNVGGLSDENVFSVNRDPTEVGAVCP